MTHFWDRVGRNSPVYRRENSPRAYCTSPGALVNGMGHKTSREWQGRQSRNKGSEWQGGRGRQEGQGWKADQEYEEPEAGPFPKGMEGVKGLTEGYAQEEKKDWNRPKTNELREGKASTWGTYESISEANVGLGVS